MAPALPATVGVRTISLVRLGDLKPAKRNAKLHALDRIKAAISEHGFVDPPIVDDRTHRLVGGHGRLEALAALRADGDGVPDGLHQDYDGEWLVPVVRGWSSTDDAEADQVNLALNRLSELGGWDDRALSAILEDLTASSPQALDLLGYSDADLEGLLKFATDGSDPDRVNLADPALVPNPDAPLVGGEHEDGGLTGDGTTGGPADDTGKRQVRCPSCGGRFVPGDR